MRSMPRRRRLLLATAVAVMALGAYTGVTVARMISTYNDLMEAKGLLLSVESSLQEEGVDASPDTLADAEYRARSARSKFHSAHDFFAGEPLLRVGGQIPWMGSQISAAKDLADIGYEGSEIGLTAVAALRAYNGVKGDEGRALGENVMAYLDATEPMMADVDERIAVITEIRDGIETHLILPPLSDLVVQLDVRLDRVEETAARYRHGRVVARHALGFGGPRSHLLLGMDNTELLPGGGLIGMYGIIAFDEGRVVERTFGEVAHLTERWQAQSGGEYIEAPGPLKRYLLRDWTWNFAVSNWSPDFPTSARQALFFYERSGVDPVDDVIAIDFVALEGLLSVLGPVSVDGYGVTVDSDNVTEEILAHIGKPLRPGGGDHAFASAVAVEVMDRALAVDQERWSTLLETLDRLARQKHLFLYAAEPQVERSVLELGWAGDVRDTPGDFLMAVNASVHSSKLNLALDERIDMSISINGDGSVQNTVVLDYENRLGEWASTHRPELVAQMLSGFYGGYLRLLVPAQAQLLELRLNDRDVGSEETKEEAGKASFGRYFALPRDSAISLSFAYAVPDSVDASERTHEYRLLVQKQPGVRATPLRLAVTLPSSAKVVSVSLNGRPLPRHSLEIETELSVDRELVLRYELS